MYETAKSYFALTKKITALIAVIALTKLKTKDAVIAGFNNGRIMFLNVCELEAFKVDDASSKCGSSWFIAAIHALTPTGIFLNTNAITNIIPVPVISRGGTLKANT